MNEAKAEKYNEIDSGAVSDYLRKNPDFFVEHPDILQEIQVPHASGEAVSLVEKQVSLLREQNQQVQKRMQELIEIARQNEQLARRMHALALTLMDAAEPKEIFTTLYENLKQHFQVDHVAVRLFAKPAFIDTYAGVEFAGKDIPEQALFKSMINKRMPLSGRLKRQQQAFLFGNDGDDIASAVIVPLHGKGWGGVLSIGSIDANRFTETMGVELLANLGEILSFILKPWI
ncbi:MAG: DUF484 family protein, partial [Gammaproteobacteria bacterium]